MRQTLSLLLFSFIYFIGTSFILSVYLTSPIPSINLQQAIHQNKITAEFLSNGDYSGDAVDYIITNKTNKAITIKIPAGTLFHPENTDEQTLIHIEDDILTLKSQGEATGTLSGYCTESNDNCPTENNNMSLGMNKNLNLDSLLTYFSNNNNTSSQYQHAIWSVTDGNNISNIINNTSSSGLRAYASELTGQENTWYSSPQNLQVGRDGRIESTTTTITGTLSFQCNAGSQVFQDVHRENGVKLISSDTYKTIRAGNITYTFTIRVKGWEKGEYYVRLHDGNNEITKYTFTV